MTKLIIQIPCYNEEETIGITLEALPREIEGVDCVEWLIVNDGSTDRTVEIAKQCGADHIVNLPHNQGLAKAFMAGVEACLKARADIIVNTDADNQYRADDIPKLVQPILNGEAQMVVGARPIDKIKHFSSSKRLLQHLGSWVVRLASNSDIPDAPSGFRAFSREAAVHLNVFNDYTYTLETIIQAGRQNIRMTWVHVQTNPDLRKSRLVKSITSYVNQSIMTIFRIFLIYQPMKFFMVLGSIPFSIGFILGVRWLYLLYAGIGHTHVPSLILAAILLLMGFQMWILGFVADLLAVNRKLLEDIQLRERRAGIHLAEDGEFLVATEVPPTRVTGGKFS
jgi:glycosyltransferase involved in cell wall biosynthesis